MITVRRAESVLEKVRGQKVLACGDVMLDAYLKGKVERFSQEAPVPIIPVAEEVFFPGGAGNAAACMAAIGAAPNLISVVGSKERIGYSGILIEECKKAGITPHFEVDSSRKTTLKLRLAAIKTTSQHIARIDIEDRHFLNKFLEAKIIKKIKTVFERQNPKALTIHDYRKGFFSTAVLETLLLLSSRQNIPIFADLKCETLFSIKDKIVSPKLFYLKPNRKESVEIAKRVKKIKSKGSSDSEISKIASIIQKYFPVNVIITRGNKGAALFEIGKKPFFVAPQEEESQFDVAGAGDTVAAILVVAYLGGADLKEALQLAVAASQVAIRKFGTSIVTKKELLNWIAAHSSKNYHEN